MIHLTEADFTRQPWKNGRGLTTELWRLERDGQLLVRLSRAMVVEDGPFSQFPGIERNLTVLDGPGFRLTGPGIDLCCDPLLPVAFPGDVPVTATGTRGLPSQDFNVMTARDLPRPRVQVMRSGTLAPEGLTAIHPLQRATANGQALAAGDLVLIRGALVLDSAGPVIVVTLPDLG
jgi:hypothetical protein